MRKIVSFFWVLVLLLASFSAAADRLLVAWTPPEKAQWTLELLATDSQPAAQVEGRLVRVSERRNYKLLSYPVSDRQQRLELMKRLQAKETVLFVERDQPVEIQSGIPDYYPHLQLNDFTLAPANCSLAPLAIIDTGVYSAHPDLDRPGLEFWPDINIVESSLASQDDDGHGTHIAGLIAANVNSTQRVAGLCDQAVLLSVKSLDGRGRGSTSSLVEGIDAALNEGVKLINASLVTGHSTLLEHAIEDAVNKGVLVIAAAGNDGRSLDSQPAYPASYSQDFPLVVSVANANSNRVLNGDSNYGLQSVDLAAPGTSLQSTWLNDEYRFLTGTSMATPLVAATLAALATDQPDLPPEAWKAMVLNSLELEPGLEGQLRYPGILNVQQALTAPLDDLARPTWFNYELNALARSIKVAGYLLNEDQVRVKYQHFDEDLTQQTLTSTWVSPYLQADLPEKLRRGQVLIFDDARQLQVIPASLDPQPLVNLTIAWDGDDILFNWQATQQTERVEIQRKNEEGDWEIIAETSPANGEFRDEQVEMGVLDYRLRTSYKARAAADSALFEEYTAEWQTRSLSRPDRLEGVPLELPEIVKNQPFKLDFAELNDYWSDWFVEEEASNFASLIDSKLTVQANEVNGLYELTLSMRRGGDQNNYKYRFQVVDELQESQQIIWEGLKVRVTRKEGNGEPWWVYPVNATRNGRNYESISIVAEDAAAFDAEWVFEFFGHSGIDLMSMSARQEKELDSWKSIPLDLQSSSRAQWILTGNDITKWTRPIGAERRQLLINPFVHLRSSSVQIDCYIASSLYGARSEQVEVLRDFRDRVLATHAPGRWLIRQYYQYSPTIAEWMDDKPRMEAITRWWLDRLVSFWAWFKSL